MRQKNPQPVRHGARRPPQRRQTPLPHPKSVRLVLGWILLAIAAGAVAPAAVRAEHWAFVAPRRPPVPATRDSAWLRNAVDAFVLARLEQEGLQPAPAADRVTLLRRLSLDLVGLPPTPEQVDTFLADTSPGAYARQVERLLDSPHYGERWGRLWLDAAGYADSDGYEKDKPRWVWAYRDWVVAALNRDLPYDQFVIEQIAGDLLPGATQEQLVATGFLRNSMINEEGGVDPEQFRMEAMFARMDAIGKSILGLTIQCGQCHDHKYDPLTQQEYYRMFAFLNNSHEANVAVYTPEEQRQRAELFRRIREIESHLQRTHSDWQLRMLEWEEQVANNPTEWVVLDPTPDQLPHEEKFRLMGDGSILAEGYAPTKMTFEISLPTQVQNISGFRLELLCDPNLPLGGPGRSIYGTAALTEFEVKAAPADAPEKAETLKIARATADVNLPERELDAIFDDKSGKRRVTGPVTFAIDGDDTTAWGIDAGPGRRNQPRKAVFALDHPISFPSGTILTFYLRQNHGGWNSDDNQNHNLGRYRLSITTAPHPVADPLPAQVREILAVPPARRSPEQVAAVFSYWRTTVPEWHEANEQIEALWHSHPAGSSQLVLQEREVPRTTHVLQRGDFLKPAQAVTPGVPAFLHPLPPGAPPTRLSFARWLVDRKSPTTARAVVNRVWQAYFGTGLVSTSEDLGAQSEPPSHPQLLDWLAVEFMEQGWSLKKLHRLIVTSSAYRQSSAVSPELYARDPANRLLARATRMRVDAEMVRDVTLAAAGLLNGKIGGPSVYPPAPAFLFVPPASYGPKVWKEEAGADRYRRALYTFRFRSVPYPVLQNFDAPNGDASCVRRARSNTPLQALTTLNETLFVECARGLASRAIEQGGASETDRLNFAFRRCVARSPTEHESQVLLDFLHEQRRRFADGELEPRLVAGLDANGSTAPSDAGSENELAAWTALARVLLNLDETITRE